MKLATIIRFLPNSSGTMALETAMLLPVFLTMALGALSYGYVIYTKQEIYFVSDQVAREIYLNPKKTSSEIIASIRSKVSTSLNMEKFTVTTSSSDIGAYEYRAININYAMPLVLFGYNDNEINISIDKKVIISD